MKIRWHPDAIADLTSIGSFIKRDNPAAARATKARIIAAIGRLSTHPRMGRPGRLPDTRELVVAGTPYIVAYRVTRTVEVAAVLHVRRNWTEAL
jgi:toxin ParE1/3/4